MDFEVTTDTTADAGAAWRALADVESWPRWTDSVTSVERLDEGELRVGSSARIRQPGLPVAVWTVTELTPGREFSWVATGPGIRTTGSHRLTPRDGGVTLWLGLDQAGPLAWLMRRALAAKTRRYLRMEVEGWKAASEAGE